MARHERVRRIYVRAKRRARRSAGAFSGPLKSIGLGALGTLLGVYVAPKVGIPATYAVSAGLGLGGVAAYALKDRRAGEGMIGGAIGLALLPSLVNLMGTHSSNPGLTILS